ncbi:MAG: hypothetical protein OEM01_01860 [Desulfobulbaceae bacterium]|nr:hypothetical protein [Desulfobulbaceae bacterium]
MKHEMEEALRDAQLAFLGRLLSGFTHELKNHLAIINEFNGLMGDLLELGMQKDDETAKKFQKIIVSIAERIEMANTLVKNLNSFGHRMDMSVTVFSVNDILREEIALMDKFVRLKGIEFDIDLQQDIPSVRNNPALFQFLGYVFIDAVLSDAKKGEKIKLVSRKENGNVVVHLEKQTDGSEKDEREADTLRTGLIAYVVEKLGVDFEREVRNNRYAYRLILPPA